MNRAAFFDAVRSSLFGGRLTAPQVSGMESILDKWASSGLTDVRWLAYMLATAYHETGATMQPITEYGGVKYFDKYDTGKLAAALGNTPQKDGDGFKYRGRGFVQITGFRNYKAFGIENNPDKALNDDVATRIMFEGMTKGIFTGKKLSDYFNGANADWVNARRIINGKDRADDIAGYGKKFYSAILAASDAPPAKAPAKQSPTAKASAVAAVTVAAAGGAYSYWHDFTSWFWGWF